MKIKLIISTIVIFFFVVLTPNVFAGGGGGGPGGGEASVTTGNSATAATAAAASAAAGNAAAAAGIGSAGTIGGGGLSGSGTASGDTGSAQSGLTCAQGNLSQCGCDSSGDQGTSAPACSGRDCYEMNIPTNPINPIAPVIPTTPSTPDTPTTPIISSPVNVCAFNQGSSCQSTANTCGQTTTGIIECNGTCSASAPDNPDYYGTVCVSEQNSCFIVGRGIIDCDNECTATIPGELSCSLPDIPTPTTSPATPTTPGFYTSDHIYLVVKSTTKTLVWNGIGQATRCTVTGPDGFSSSYTYTQTESLNSTISGSVVTPQIEHKSEFTLTCYNGNGSNAPSASVSFFINLIPMYREI